jgi:hypothetical protein
VSASTIMFEHNGFPVDLITDADIKRAIDSGRLRRDTPVVVYDSQGRGTSCLADEVPRIGTFFPRSEMDAKGESIGAAPAQADLEPPARAAAAATPMPASGEAAAPAADEDPYGEADGYRYDDAADDEPYDAPDPPYPPPPPPPPASGTAMLVLGLLGGAMLVILILALAGGSDTASGPGASEPDLMDAGNMMVPAGPVDEELGPARTMYAVRRATVRSGPSSSAGEIASAGRGEMLYGIPVRRNAGGQEWLRLESGPWAGSYVWLANLAEQAPPALSLEMDEQRRVAVPTTVFAAPFEDAETLQTLEPGTEVALLGELASGWWEVGLRRGGVGFLPPGAFTPPAAPMQGLSVSLRNDCTYKIDVRLVLDTGFGMSDAGGGFWSVGAGETILIGQNNRPITAVSDEIFYHVSTPTGPWQHRNPVTFTHGGRSLGMARASVEMLGNGYLLRFC